DNEHGLHRSKYGMGRVPSHRRRPLLDGGQGAGIPVAVKIADRRRSTAEAAADASAAEYCDVS
ncbi:MAG: hypothetical protein KA806_07115, partial [Sulfuritalea sp.]|nr:hypothetical protein [Sulfuritalea sp.]